MSQRAQLVNRHSKLSGAYLALLIGSGFATGQEAMQFFVVYGWNGLWRHPRCLSLLLVLMYTPASRMKAGRQDATAIVTNEEAFRHFCGPILGVVPDLVHDGHDCCSYRCDARRCGGNTGSGIRMCRIMQAQA